MRKLLDNLEDLSVESSLVILTDFIKRVGAGIVIGLFGLSIAGQQRLANPVTT